MIYIYKYSVNVYRTVAPTCFVVSSEMEDQGRGYFKVDASYANANNMHIIYLKDPEFPDEEVDVPTPTTRYVVAIGKEFVRAEFLADDFEEGLLETMMGHHLWYKACKQREEAGRRSSKRKRNPIHTRQITFSPPLAHAQIANALQRLKCGEDDRLLMQKYMDAAFVDLSRFRDVDKAIAHGKDMIRWIQERMEDGYQKWGQSSCNMGVVHPLQVDDGLQYNHRIFRFGDLGPHLSLHPLDRVKLHKSTADNRRRYSEKFFSEVNIRVVFVWPGSFVGVNNELWKQALGELEMFSQAHWLATRGEDFSGNLTINCSGFDLKYPPVEANSLLSFIYSASYKSQWLMREHMRELRSASDEQETKQTVQDYPHKLHIRSQELVANYKRQVLLPPPPDAFFHRPSSTCATISQAPCFSPHVSLSQCRFPHVQMSDRPRALTLNSISSDAMLAINAPHPVERPPEMYKFKRSMAGPQGPAPIKVIDRPAGKRKIVQPRKFDVEDDRDELTRGFRFPHQFLDPASVLKLSAGGASSSREWM